MLYSKQNRKPIWCFSKYLQYYTSAASPALLCPTQPLPVVSLSALAEAIAEPFLKLFCILSDVTKTYNGELHALLTLNAAAGMRPKPRLSAARRWLWWWWWQQRLMR